MMADPVEKNAAMPDETIGIRLLTGEPQEMRELQRVLEEAPTYARRRNCPVLPSMQ